MRKEKKASPKYSEVDVESELAKLQEKEDQNMYQQLVKDYNNAKISSTECPFKISEKVKKTNKLIITRMMEVPYLKTRGASVEIGRTINT